MNDSQREECKMFEQKRKQKRFKTLTLVDILGANSKVKDRAAVMDISMAGLAFESNTMFSEGDEVLFNFFPLALNVMGIVKRVERSIGVYFHGVEFENISFNNKIVLSKLISKICD